MNVAKLLKNILRIIKHFRYYFFPNVILKFSFSTESYIDRSLYSRPDGNSEMWITVFGFAHSALPRVLSYFSQYGSIIETKPSKNGGNWVHIRYSSRFEVNNALSRNGKKIQPGLIIGVMLCDEPV